MSRGLATFRSRLAMVFAVGFLAGCYSFPENNGYYLVEGTSDDVGIYLEEVRIFLPVPGGPIYLDTNLFVGGLYLFAPGDPMVAKHFTFPETPYALDGSFSVTGTNDADPTETVQVTGKCTDPDGDGTPDDLVATVALPDGTRDLTLPRVDRMDYDHYKCWLGPGKCGISLGAAECSYTPLGDGSYELSAEVPFKAPYDNVDGGWTEIGEAYPGGGTDCYPIPLAGSKLCDWGTGPFTVTTTLAGSTQGTVGFHVPSVIFHPNPPYTDLGFRVNSVGTDPIFVGATSCPLP